MELFLVTFGAMLVAVFAMAIGVLCGRLPIAGSCGGLNTVDGVCQSCTRPCKSRRKTHGSKAQRKHSEVINDRQHHRPQPVLLHRHPDTGSRTATTPDMESTNAQSTKSQ